MWLQQLVVVTVRQFFVVGSSFVISRGELFNELREEGVIKLIIIECSSYVVS